jgi:hypothetical protein
MNKDFTLYPEAFELKQLGFDEPCLGHYSNGEFVYSSHTNNTMQRFRYAAPLYSQAFRWFREKYDLYTNITKYNDENDTQDKFYYYISDGYMREEFNTYEEAELACLKNLIEIVKGGNK